MAVFLKIDKVRPSNVLMLSNTNNQYSGKKDHPAVFPDKLAEFLILSFSDVGDVVYDPFAGSGTVLVEAQRLGRQFIGSEINEKFYEMIKGRLK